MVPATATGNPKTQAMARAFARATAEQIVVYRTSNPDLLGVASIVDGVFTRKPYTITVIGTRPQDVTCDCIAGQRGQTCKHAAAAVFARKYGVYATRPVQPVAKADPLAEVFA